METENKTYLGDGLYAELDPANMIKLSADRYGNEHYVYLEPDVFAAFCRWVTAIGWGNIMRANLRKEMPPEDPAAKSASTSK